MILHEKACEMILCNLFTFQKRIFIILSRLASLFRFNSVTENVKGLEGFWENAPTSKSLWNFNDIDCHNWKGKNQLLYVASYHFPD